jgi:hypothetical protein
MEHVINLREQHVFLAFYQRVGDVLEFMAYDRALEIMFGCSGPDGVQEAGFSTDELPDLLNSMFRLEHFSVLFQD